MRNFHLIKIILISVIFFFGQFTRAADLIIPAGFEQGCNPCTGKLEDGRTFELSFVTNEQKYLTTVRLDAFEFEVQGGERLSFYSERYPPFVNVQFDGSDETRLYAIQAPSGVYNINYHYFWLGNQKWTYLGNLPQLNLDVETGVYWGGKRFDDNVIESWFEIKDGKIREVEPIK